MRISVYLPWLAAAVLAAATPLVSRRLQPRLAAVSLAGAAAVIAAASTWALVLLAAALLELAPPVQERTSARPVPLLVGLAAVAALVALTRRARRVHEVRRQTTAALHAVCRLCPGDGELAVTGDGSVYAYAVPGRPGRVLVSSGLLQTASGSQRRVVLAHERAHLRQGHHLLRAAADLAAAVNPLLSRTRDAVGYLVERAADEDAAAAVGSRDEAAFALAEVALTGHPTSETSGALMGFHRHGVVARVEALRRPPAAATALWAVACLTGAGCTVVAVGDATVSLGRFAAAVTGI